MVRCRTCNGETRGYATCVELNRRCTSDAPCGGGLHARAALRGRGKPHLLT
jgi:hypothetical protein